MELDLIEKIKKSGVKLELEAADPDSDPTEEEKTNKMICALETHQPDIKVMPPPLLRVSFKQ